MPARTLKRLGIRKLEHLALQLGLAERHLVYFTKSTSLYVPHSFRDKKGTERRGFIPSKEFRPVADRIKDLVKRIEMPEWLQGGIPNRSAVKNAIPHIDKPFVYNLDLSKFYPSIHRMMVYRAFVRVAGCSPDVARVLTKLTTCDNQLPQGSPPSAFIAAMVSIPMADRLRALAVQHQADYTQYVDDITMSGPAHLAHLEKLIEGIVRSEGFVLNRKKTMRLPRDGEQKVTGVRVNRRLDAPDAMYAEVTREIEMWEAGTGDRGSLSSLKGTLAYMRGLWPTKVLPLMNRLAAAVPPDAVLPSAVHHRPAAGRQATTAAQPPAVASDTDLDLF